MSVIDGGVYKCGNGHDEEYTTTNADEWAEHMASHANDDNVVTIRSGSCVICNKPVLDQKTGVGMNAVHTECIESLASRRAAT